MFNCLVRSCGSGIENSSLHIMFYELQHAEEELISILFLIPREVLEVITTKK